MKKLVQLPLLVAGAAFLLPAMAQEIGSYPPNAKPGECYTKALVPASFETKSERVLIQEAGERIEVIPATYKRVKKRVLVQEPGERLEVIPATYKTVTERVLVKPAVTKLIRSEPVYETVTERVLVAPATTIWKPGTGAITQVNNSTGEIMCLVEVPAKYKTVTRKVLKTPAGTTERTEPAQYETITKKVVATPPSTRSVSIPAKYNDIFVTEEVQPATTRRIPIAEKYETVTKRVQVSEERLSWAPILCQTNVSGNIITELQRALRAKGYNPGPVDGVYGQETRSAISAYQRRQGLARGGLTLETLNALGVSI